MRRFRKSLGLLAVVGGLFLAGAGSAHAAGWHGGGHAAVGGHGSAVHVGGGGWHGAAVGPAGGWRGNYVPGRAVAPGWHHGYAPVYRGVPVARAWAPGYWGYHGGTRVWIGGAWSYPPQPGWVWVAPHWQWNGYQWVWQQGYWAAPTY